MKEPIATRGKTSEHEKTWYMRYHNWFNDPKPTREAVCKCIFTMVSVSLIVGIIACIFVNLEHVEANPIDMIGEVIGYTSATVALISWAMLALDSGAKVAICMNEKK